MLNGEAAALQERIERKRSEVAAVSDAWSETVGELLNRGALVEIKDGNHGELHPKSSDYTDSGIPFVMAGDLADGTLDLDACAHLSPDQGLRVLGSASLARVMCSYHTKATLA